MISTDMTGSWILLGRTCAREEYEAFKARLRLANDPLEALHEGECIRAEWDGLDPATGDRYKISEGRDGFHAIVATARPEPSWDLCGRCCSREEYEAFKARLTLSSNFVDETTPSRFGSGVGGYSAIWDATDAAGRRYKVYESGGENGESFRIEPEPDADE